jgi:hypothetical protein
MSATTVAAPTTLRAHINYWQYPREIRIEENRVGIQVTVPTCSHCPTCQERVRTFLGTLQGKPEVEHSWNYLGGAEWLFISKTSDEDGLDVLRKVLEISIEEI